MIYLSDFKWYRKLYGGIWKKINYYNKRKQKIITRYRYVNNGKYMEQTLLIENFTKKKKK